MFRCFPFLYKRIVPLGFLPWKIRIAYPRENQLRQTRATQPTVHAGCFSVAIIHRTLDMDYRIFCVRTYVNACHCTQVCTDTVRESALKVDWERNPLPYRGIAPASAACRSGALPTQPTSPLAYHIALCSRNYPEGNKCAYCVRGVLSVSIYVFFKNIPNYA